MEPSDYRLLLNLARRTGQRVTTKPPTLTRLFGQAVGALVEWSHTGPSDLLANWILDHDIRFQGARPSSWHLYRGQIVEVQLGYGPPEEFSFRHPCMVLKAQATSVIVVPMTSQRYGQGVATAPGQQDGPNRCQVDFELAAHPGSPPSRSSLLLDQVRGVSRRRVLSVWKDGDHGRPVRVAPAVTAKVDEILAMLVVPSLYRRWRDASAACESLVRERQDLERRLAALEVAAGEQRDTASPTTSTSS